MGIYAFRLFRVVVFACLATLHSGCVEQHEAIEPDAQVIVIGAGLSGLSAAVELGRRGIDVLVVDMNSVAGGHTMLAGGVAMAATQLQEELGIEDSAEQAYRDWMDWTEDGDARWTRYYAENSREMIYDWVTEMGVEFVRIAPSHGNSVARFHFTKGRAAHLVLPIYRTALGMPNISYLWNSRAEELLLEDGRVTGVVVKELRSGEVRSLRAGNVVLATGGFETDVERVLANWISDLPRPDRLLIGAAISATGSGHDMATAAGAALDKINRHFIYVNGVIDPRDPQQRRTFSSIWCSRNRPPTGWCSMKRCVRVSACAVRPGLRPRRRNTRSLIIHRRPNARRAWRNWQPWRDCQAKPSCKACGNTTT
jgi:predicted oxidoreductase